VEDIVPADSLYLLLEIGVIGQLYLAIVVKYSWELGRNINYAMRVVDRSYLLPENEKA
jgi:hypothetical protein